MTHIQDWIQLWLRRDDREFEESIAREQQSRQAHQIPVEVQRIVARLDRERHERDQFPVGAFRDTIDANRHGGRRPTSEQLLTVAEVGKDLLYQAVCIADEGDNAEFFVHAYEQWGPLVDTVLQECGRGLRDTATGRTLRSR